MAVPGKVANSGDYWLDGAAQAETLRPTPARYAAPLLLRALLLCLVLVSPATAVELPGRVVGIGPVVKMSLRAWFGL